ncbi:MAG TPA: 2-amino-4-hydroxy-6-hydroxymethyldihydropteridine diphosphokinase [Vicinamibacterales bacterium]|nr:2-amino-4-hydroxy-6-hydroxymethyldihydropteridine diphosphokinase [Vicinamibacterales bacterium]
MSQTPHARVYLAFGGNVGDSRAILDRAVTRLCDGKDVTLVARSSDYRTPPWGVKDQPPFINLCVVAETALKPRELLARAHEVERALGRDRAHETRWGPRTVDIDIIAYDGVTLDGPDLVLPHPRLFERAFVLMPLAEIAPDTEIAGKRVSEWLAAVDTPDITKLPLR